MLEVRCITLSQLIADNNLEKVDLLKLNCEGAEYEILYSSADCLRRVDKVRLEYHNLDERRSNVTSLAGFLIQQGFRITQEYPYTDMDGFLWADRSY